MFFRGIAAPSLGALLVAGLLVAGAAPRASAQDDEYVTRPLGQVGLHAGYFESRDAKEGNVLGGAHVEFMPIPWLGIQGAVDYRNEERFDVQIGGVNHELDVRTIPVTATGKLYLPISARFAPFGELGAGWYHQVFDYSEDLEMLGLRDRDVRTFGWHTGLGANIQVRPRLGLYGEMRWIFLDPDQDLDDEILDRLTDFDFNSIHALGGFSVMF